MSLQLRINIKGASKKLSQIEYEYEDVSEGAIQVEEFLDKTVEITWNRYQKDDKLVQLLTVLSKEEIEEQAEVGKVSFGVHYNEKRISLDKAKENARQCFLDGLVALFVDGNRYEKLEDTIILHEHSEVTFVKMTFLAGRMW